MEEFTIIIISLRKWVANLRQKRLSSTTKSGNRTKRRTPFQRIPQLKTWSRKKNAKNSPTKWKTGTSRSTSSNNVKMHKTDYLYSLLSFIIFSSQLCLREKKFNFIVKLKLLQINSPASVIFCWHTYKSLELMWTKVFEVVSNRSDPTGYRYEC